MVGADRRQWRGKIDAVTSNGRSSYAHSRYGYAATTGDEKPEKPPARGKVGVLFQEAENQLFHSTVADEIAFGLKLQKCPADEITQRTHAALQCCQLADTANSHPLDLHSAQRRMVAVACLEALSPPLLLLDEPSRDFDENWLSVFESWLEKCRQRGTSVVAISHDAAFTRRHFSRVVRLEDGLIRNVNPPDDIHP